mmetsp:Transcript_53105/g.126688  ORF Transcript_53105/g.126688 Transcript_53105/m.126688 type:complete len:212 (-) Transcript_53105:488-1123(-)
MATMTAPPTMLPTNTGSRFFKNTAFHETAPPAKMPRGSKNMFATECSKPIATKVEMGNQMPTILPAISDAEDAMKMAMQTSQLQNTALIKVSIKGMEVFFTRVVSARALVPSTTSPHLTAKAAMPTQPMKFPKEEMTMVRHSDLQVARPSKTAAGTVMALPVTNCAPLFRTNSKFIGNSAAKIILWIPGLEAVMPCMLPEMDSAKRPAKAT